ncbi:MAG TPA: single-stranded DNA-binding protein [Gaiellaceae bacterium]|nr:single-stranded DNA-binding protein [Gaiellaceae bacterium]
MNIVTLIGNLATDVDLRELGEKKVAGFLLAIDRPGGGADFVWISAWDRQAELCREYLGKGKRVALEGRLRSHSWDEEGKRRTKVEVVASRVQFLSGPDEQAVAADTPFEQAAAV